MRRILITGACGFLGRNTALLFKQKGWSVVGLGHGHWGFDSPQTFGIDEWIDADVDLEGLSHIKGSLDAVFHCAGGSSVGHSVSHPLREFRRTVDSAANVLEFVRLYHPGVHFIYPSSAAVYGDHQDTPLSEQCISAPVSPYGFYKRIVEDLCLSYVKNFALNITVVRFFSIYGAGLQKQLLWDACGKLCGGNSTVSFYGTGEETRDWIHIRDAAELVYTLLVRDKKGFDIMNGGSGKRITVSGILSMVSAELGASANITMGKEEKKGDPRHYWADISKIRMLGWQPQVSLEDGVKEYVQWFKEHNHGGL